MRGGRKAYNAKELLRSADGLGPEINVPDTNTRRALGQIERHMRVIAFRRDQWVVAGLAEPDQNTGGGPMDRKCRPQPLGAPRGFDLATAAILQNRLKYPRKIRGGEFRKDGEEPLTDAVAAVDAPECQGTSVCAFDCQVAFESDECFAGGLNEIHQIGRTWRRSACVAQSLPHRQTKPSCYRPGKTP
jgi:hypothetical protein